MNPTNAAGKCHRYLLAALPFLAIVANLAACTHSAHDTETIVALVGRAPIRKSAVEHWMTVLAPQHVAATPPRFTACVRQQELAQSAQQTNREESCRKEYAELKQQAVSFLISSKWLGAEAKAQGVPVSREQVDTRLDQRRHSFTSESEFQESLKAIAHTVDDVELEIEDEIAEENIRRRLVEGEPRVTYGEVVAYYRDHIKSYHVPESRYFDIAENYPSAAVARRRMREVKAGRSFSGMTLHESLPRKAFYNYTGEKRVIYEAIFKAPPHVLTGPIRLNHYYFLIEITRITPAHLQSISEVQASIVNGLRFSQRERILAAFIRAWRTRWKARTRCLPAYVVNKCSEYHGPKHHEAPLELD